MKLRFRIIGSLFLFPDSDAAPTDDLFDAFELLRRGALEQGCCHVIRSDGHPNQRPAITVKSLRCNELTDLSRRGRPMPAEPPPGEVAPRGDFTLLPARSPVLEAAGETPAEDFGRVRVIARTFLPAN
jgi:hypothetical protein